MSFDTLISAEQLAAHAQDATWRIFDCRHNLADPQAGEQAYRAAHIANAQFLHLERDLSGSKTGRNGRHPLPDPAILATTLSRYGVSRQTQVIAYDDAGGMFAVRLRWLLRWLGHDRVAVLDGGWSAWQGAGYPVSRDVPPPSPATFVPQQRDDTVDAAYVQTHLHSTEVLLLDARAPDRYRGENETLDPVAGHIPGAVNRFYKDNLAADGRFKPPAQLRAELDALTQKNPRAQIVAYCGSGVSACHNLLALELAGQHGARLYPGSWSEWCSDPTRPVATGTE